jgi:uroporphyrinogen-III synthase
MVVSVIPVRVCSFESRRCDEMRSLIERQGGVATVVSSMREVPRDANPEVFRFVESLLAGKFDLVVFLTGVGARILLEVAETRFERAAILDALRQVTVAVRGPKPVVVLREWDVPVAIRAAEPNTWRELVTALADSGAINGKRLAIQEYGRPNTELYEELRRRGANVEAVPVYRWELPADTEPLRQALQETIAGRIDVLLFTSAHQIDNVLEVAEAADEKEAWLRAAQACVIASIGPTASEALRDSGLRVDVEAQPTRMGQLVRSALEAAPAILAAKRA